MVKSRRKYILLGICFKHHPPGMTAVRVGMIAAKGGDFYAIHQHHAKLRAHQLSPGKQPQQFFRTRIG